MAYELGMLDGLGPGTMNLFAPTNEGETNPDGSAIDTTARFYDHLLECCENFFAGDLDQSTFEENLRFMFGTKAYLMFTVDKVIAALIKQVSCSQSICFEGLTNARAPGAHGNHRPPYRRAPYITSKGKAC